MQIMKLQRHELGRKGMKEIELQDCDIWISGSNACLVLGISDTTLKRYCTKGKLPENCFKKLNSRMVRYNLQGLKDWMEESEFASDDLAKYEKITHIDGHRLAVCKREAKAESKQRTKDVIASRIKALEK
jgi:predicted DNA-binding transcriptional regulator AlpA